MAFACESDFRNYLVELITRARLRLFQELPARSMGETRRGVLRCDIAIPRPSAAGVVAIIECKVETDPQSLFTALGQAQIYRRAFGADHAIVCFPLSARLPTLFLEEFQERGVTVAFGREILGALAECGLIEEPVAANHMLMDWLDSQDFSKWSVEELEAWSKRLRVLCEACERIRQACESLREAKR